MIFDPRKEKNMKIYCGIFLKAIIEKIAYAET